LWKLPQAVEPLSQLLAENAYSTIYVFKAALEKARKPQDRDLIKAMEGMKIMTLPERFFRPEDHQGDLRCTRVNNKGPQLSHSRPG